MGGDCGLEKGSEDATEAAVGCFRVWKGSVAFEDCDAEWWGGHSCRIYVVSGGWRGRLKV